MPSRIRSTLAACARWFDTAAKVPSSAAVAAAPDKIEWLRCLPFVFLHVACLGVIWVGWSWIAVSTCAALYVIRMFFITGFYHRYFSHRSFKASRLVQFLMAVAGSSAVQRGPLWWAAHHRHHHRHSDQPEDVHSPIQHSFLWSHIGWITSRQNFATDFEAVADLAKFPELRFLDRFDTLVPILLAIILFFAGVALGDAWNTSGMQMLVWGFFVSTVFLFHGTCTINSLTHLFGAQRYKTGDHSRNSLLLALITLGEGWHNNHHYYQNSTRQGFYWWEIDITFYALKALSLLRLVRELKPVPLRVRDQR